MVDDKEQGHTDHVGDIWPKTAGQVKSAPNVFTARSQTLKGGGTFKNS